MTDEVPDAAAEFLNLAARFLHLIFAEAQDASANGCAITSAGCVLLTAMSSISDASRPDFCAAAAITSWILRKRNEKSSIR